MKVSSHWLFFMQSSERVTIHAKVP